MPPAVNLGNNKVNKQMPGFICIRQCLLIYFHIVLAVASQKVKVEPLSPQPSCPSQELVYSCQVEFLSLALRWEHSEFGTLGFVASNNTVGDTKMTSDGRIVATLTENEETSEGTVSERMMSSISTVQPPLNDLNGTKLKCEGFELAGGNHSNETVIDLTGE